MFNMQHQNDTTKFNFVSALEHFWKSWSNAAFIRETGTRKSILISMVTTYGVKENMYSDAVQSQVVMDNLFA